MLKTGQGNNLLPGISNLFIPLSLTTRTKSHQAQEKNISTLNFKAHFFCLINF